MYPQQMCDFINQVLGLLGLYYGVVNATYVAYHPLLLCSPDFASTHPPPPYLHHNTCLPLMPVGGIIRYL